MKKPKHRIFDYTPRFYKPEDDKAERQKRRLGFTRQRKYNARKKSPLIYLLLIIIVIYILIKLIH